MADLNLLKQKNAQRWANMQIRPERLNLVQKVVYRLTASAAKQAYQEVEAETGVPWMVVAVIHERESNQRWDRSLAQGDPWTQVSTHVPKGRGPFSSWQEAAIDALVVAPPHAAKWKDWSIGGTLTILEQYNGLGYANGPRDALGNRWPPQPSPYIWAATNQYTRGKYIRDGVFDPNHIDQQLGCAAMLKMMGYAGKVQTQPPIAPPKPTEIPKETKPVPPTFFQSVVNFFRSLFRRG